MIPTHSLWDAHMFLDSNMCFHLNCWNVYMALQRVINISKSSKNEGPLWPHTLCFDSGFKMSESHKAEQAAFYISLQVKEELRNRKKRNKNPSIDCICLCHHSQPKANLRFLLFVFSFLSLVASLPQLKAEYSELPKYWVQVGHEPTSDNAKEGGFRHST